MNRSGNTGNTRLLWETEGDVFYCMRSCVLRNKKHTSCEDAQLAARSL